MAWKKSYHANYWKKATIRTLTVCDVWKYLLKHQQFPLKSVWSSLSDVQWWEHYLAKLFQFSVLLSRFRSHEIPFSKHQQLPMKPARSNGNDGGIRASRRLFSFRSRLLAHFHYAHKSSYNVQVDHFCSHAPLSTSMCCLFSLLSWFQFT